MSESNPFLDFAVNIVGWLLSVILRCAGVVSACNSSRVQVREVRAYVADCGDQFEPFDRMDWDSEDEDCNGLHECILDDGHNGDHECHCGKQWPDMIPISELRKYIKP